MTIRIGLLNHMGFGNLGDDTTLDAVMQNIRRRWPHAEFTAFCMNPGDTQKRHDVTSYVIRKEFRDSFRSPGREGGSKTARSRLKSVIRKNRFLFVVLRPAVPAVRAVKRFVHELAFLVESFRVVRSLDLFIICGGGQLLDGWGGPWSFPYTIFKWIALAKLSRKKCYIVNVGAGPLDSPLSRGFVRLALAIADYASFRDAKSKALVRSIGFSGKSDVLPDCVYGLAPPAQGVALARLTRTPPIIGIAPMAYCDPRRYWDKRQAVYDGFIEKMGDFCASLAESGNRITLFSTELWFDSDAMDDVAAVFAERAKGFGRNGAMRARISGTEELISEMSRMDYIVTCRFHGVVFAHLMNIPVIAISHHPKVATLMGDLGLSDYCFDIHTFDVEMLMKAFITLANSRDQVKARMAEKAADYKRRLTMQFDALFPESMRSGNEPI